MWSKSEEDPEILLFTRPGLHQKLEALRVDHRMARFCSHQVTARADGDEPNKALAAALGSGGVDAAGKAKLPQNKRKKNAQQVCQN